MRLIINADDFGINKVVTSEIERLVNLGKISSTTIMANGECLEEVKRFALLHPEISFGVHLCLSEFSSITKSPILCKYGLTDEQGNFITKAIFKVEYFNEELKQAIKSELLAQIKTVYSLGIPLSHCDSHHHVHTIKGLTELFKEVLDNNNYTKIRLCSSFTTLREKLHILNAFRRYKINTFYKCHFRTADAFFSYSSFLTEAQKYDSNSTIELMCHPGHPATKYKAEIQLLENDELKNKVNYKLISYNEL